MKRRMREIIEKNKEFEKESPYNFCDRWCKKCAHEKQMRCKLYQDELEQDMLCIAHGKEPGDPEITEAVMRRQLEELDEKIEEGMDKFGIDLDEPDTAGDRFNEEDEVKLEDLPEEVQKHIRFVDNNPLRNVSKQYQLKAHAFLEQTFYNDNPVDSGLKDDFDALSWYHTLLPAKISRALAGFHEPMTEGDYALYDAVAQFEICKKAVQESIKALNRLKPRYSGFAKSLNELLALLHSISDQIKLIEEEV